MHTYDRDIEDRVWRLRYISRWNYRRISKTVGVSLGSVHNILKRRALDLGQSTGRSLPLKPRAISLDDAHDFEWNQFIAGPGSARHERVSPVERQKDPSDAEPAESGNDLQSGGRR